MAAGLVVLRGSPGEERLSSGSSASSRLTPSPLVRQKLVRADGPPTEDSSRLAQVLSDSSTAPLHRVSIDSAPLAMLSLALATGA